MFVAKMYTRVNKIQVRTEADKRIAGRATNDGRTSQSAPVPGELLHIKLTSHYTAGGLTGMCVRASVYPHVINLKIVIVLYFQFKLLRVCLWSVHATHHSEWLSCSLTFYSTCWIN